MAKDIYSLIWEKIKNRLKESLNEVGYKKHFAKSKYVKFEDNKIFIEVESEQTVTRIKNTFLGTFKDYLELFNSEFVEDITKFDFEFIVNQNSNNVKVKEQLLEPIKSEYNNLNPKYTFENFVVGSSNDFAFSIASSLKPGFNDYNPFFIYGGTGLGKTHLLQAVGHKYLQLKRDVKVLYTSSGKFTSDFIESIDKRTINSFKNRFKEVDLLIVDDIQFFSNKERTQEEFFHIFNYLYENGKQIILSCDTPPAEIKGLEERLISRFENGMIADIQKPDFELRTAILKRLAEKESIDITQEALFFIAENVKANIRRLEGAFLRVSAYASYKKRKIDIALIKEVLQDLLRNNREKITPSTIKEVVSEILNVDISKMESSVRTKEVSNARKISMALISEYTDLSLKQIGALFGGMDHSTVLYAKKTFSEAKFDINKEVCKNYLKIKAKLEDLRG